MNRRMIAATTLLTASAAFAQTEAQHQGGESRLDQAGSGNTNHVSQFSPSGPTSIASAITTISIPQVTVVPLGACDSHAFSVLYNRFASDYVMNRTNYERLVDLTEKSFTIETVGLPMDEKTRGIVAASVKRETESRAQAWQKILSRNAQGANPNITGNVNTANQHSTRVDSGASAQSSDQSSGVTSGNHITYVLSAGTVAIPERYRVHHIKYTCE